MLLGQLAPVLLLAAFLGSAAQLVSAQDNTTSTATLIVTAGGCEGHAWGSHGNKIGYSVLLTGLVVPATCNATSDVRISKLYVEGACASSRDNSLACVQARDALTIPRLRLNPAVWMLWPMYRYPRTLVRTPGARPSNRVAVLLRHGSLRLMTESLPAACQAGPAIGPDLLGQGRERR